MPTDWSNIREVNPELADSIEESTRPPKTPFEIVAEAYPGLALFLEGLQTPSGAQGLFNHNFSHSRIDTGGDDDLANFDTATLSAMPRASGPGQAQIADKKGRLHDVFKLQQKLDKVKGISYSADANPYEANKLMGGS